MPDYRETTINLVYDEDVAYVWSNNRRMVNRLKRMGAQIQETAAHGTRFRTPLAWWSPRKPPSRRTFSSKAGRPFTKRGAA